MTPSSAQPRPRGRFWLILLIAPILSAALLHVETERQGQSGAKIFGVDFYGYWVVGTMQRLSEFALGSPYSHGDAYLLAREAFARHRLEDEPLSRTTAFWSDPSLQRLFRSNATPLLYTAFSWWPADYTRALTLFHLFHLAGWTIGLLMMGALFLWGRTPLFLLTCGLLVLAYPVQRDFLVANISSLLFAALACIGALAGNADPSRDDVSLVRKTGAAALLTALTFLKPVVLLPCLFLLTYLVATGTHGTRLSILGATALTAGLCMVLSGWFFRTPDIWGEWFHFAWTQKQVFFLGSRGNGSLAALASLWTAADPVLLSFTIGSALTASLAITLQRRIGVRWSHAMLNRETLRAIGRPILRPPALVSLGILLTLATSPLVWTHYYVLALFPGFWILAECGRRMRPVILVFAFWAAQSAPLDGVFWSLGRPGWGDVVRCGSLLLLWTAFLSIFTDRSPAPTAVAVLSPSSPQP